MAAFVFPTLMVDTANVASAAPTYTVTANINTGSDPYGVAVDPVTDTVYVANNDSASVSVIDGATNTVTATIGVGAAPYGLAVDPVTDTIYVANLEANDVSVIDGATNTVTATVGVGEEPYGVSVDPATDTIYVANTISNTVSVIDGATNTLTTTVGVGAYPVGLSVDPLTDTVYVGSADFGGVSVIDGATDTVTATIDEGSSMAGLLAVDPSTDILYATDSANAVTVIDGATDTVTASVTVGNFPSAVSVDPSTDTVYVVNTGSDKTISVIDGATNTLTATVGTDEGIPTAVGVNPTTDIVYVTDSGDSVEVITPTLTAPDAPGAPIATAGNKSATVTFAPPATDGGTPITGYLVTATDTTTGANGGQTATGTTSPITVTGLKNGDSYTFAVTATNTIGTSALSSPSNAVTPNAVKPSADLAVTIRVPTTSGPRHFYVRITVTDHGPTAAAAITTSLVVLNGLTVPYAPGATIIHGQSATWSLPALASGESYSFSAGVRPLTRGTHELAAITISNRTPDPDVYNNVASTTVTIS